MQALFDSLTHAVESAPLLALAAASVWGGLSIVLSPCHLAGIPLIVAFIAGQHEVSGRRAFAISGAFAVGILLTIAAIGLVTSSLGRLAGDLGAWGNYVAAGVFFAVGLHLTGVVPLAFSGPSSVPIRWHGVPAAFVLGLVFGIALGPCTFAFMAPVLAASFKVASAAPVFAAGLLLAYGIGHCAVLVGAGASTTGVQKMLNWSSGSSGAPGFRFLCGVLVLLGGLYMVYTAR